MDPQLLQLLMGFGQMGYDQGFGQGTAPNLGGLMQQNLLGSTFGLPQQMQQALGGMNQGLQQNALMQRSANSQNAQLGNNLDVANIQRGMGQDKISGLMAMLPMLGLGGGFAGQGGAGGGPFGFQTNYASPGGGMAGVSFGGPQSVHGNLPPTAGQMPGQQQAPSMPGAGGQPQAGGWPDPTGGMMGGGGGGMMGGGGMAGGGMQMPGAPGSPGNQFDPLPGGMMGGGMQPQMGGQMGGMPQQQTPAQQQQQQFPYRTMSGMAGMSDNPMSPYLNQDQMGYQPPNPTTGQLGLADQAAFRDNLYGNPNGPLGYVPRPTRSPTTAAQQPNAIRAQFGLPPAGQRTPIPGAGMPQSRPGVQRNPAMIPRRPPGY